MLSVIVILEVVSFLFWSAFIVVFLEVQVLIDEVVISSN